MKSNYRTQTTCSFRLYPQWVVLCLLAYSLSAGIRLLDVPSWQAPHLDLGHEKLMTRYDSYGWLAGAEGVNEFSGHPFAGLLRFISDTTGMTVGDVGFWLPALLAPLVAVPVCLLALWWGAPRSGIASSVIAGGSFVYLSRTRLGCLDSDLYSLLFPVCLGVGLVMWLEPNLRRPWNRGRSQSAAGLILGAALLGLLLYVYWQFYAPGLGIGLSVWGVALLIAFLFGASGRRLLTVAAMMLMLVLGVSVVTGLLLAAVALALAKIQPALFTKSKMLVALIVVLTGWLSYQGYLQGIHSQIGSQVSRYAARSAPSEATGSPILPDTVATLEEARRVPFTVAARLMGGHWVLFIIGVSGFANLLLRRPSGLVFLPLLVLGLASTQLGYRFAMYGGVAIGMGLCIGWALPLREWKSSAAIQLSMQLLILIAILGLNFKDLKDSRPNSFLTTTYARALSEVGEIAAPGAQIWSWWDFGFAAQYYTRRMTFADGSRNTGEYVLPLASIFTTSHPEHAYRLMVYTAREQKAAVGKKEPLAASSVAVNPFFSVIHDRTPHEAQQLLDRIRNTPPAGTENLSEQYLVVSWENVELAETLYEFGTWNIVDGTSSTAGIVALPGNLRFDLDTGVVHLGSKSHYLRTLDVITPRGGSHSAWPKNTTGMNVIRNGITDRVLAMDENLYSSLMVQMLIADPGDFMPHFDLVVDRAPFARVYRLNPGYAPAAPPRTGKGAGPM